MQAERSISRRDMLFGTMRSHGDSVIQIEGHCLSLSGVACRVCEDACAARAIRFLSRLGAVDQLSVDATACTGCGDCVPVCPVAALSLEGTSSHG